MSKSKELIKPTLIIDMEKIKELRKAITTIKTDLDLRFDLFSIASIAFGRILLRSSLSLVENIF